MSYISKAFVEIKNKKQRDFVKEELNKIFRRSTNSKFERSPFFLFANGSYEQNNKYCMFLSSKRDAGFIDCNFYANGDEDLAVKLFLVLAKMRTDTDNRFKYADFPYFENGIVRTIERDQIIDTKKEKWNDFKCKELYTDLTPEQLAEAVQKGDIKLDNHE